MIFYNFMRKRIFGVLAYLVLACILEFLLWRKCLQYHSLNRICFHNLINSQIQIYSHFLINFQIHFISVKQVCFHNQKILQSQDYSVNLQCFLFPISLVILIYSPIPIIFQFQNNSVNQIH